MTDDLPKWKPVKDDYFPENHCVSEIFDLLIGMDGMNNCMALGILECVKECIFRNMGDDEE